MFPPPDYTPSTLISPHLFFFFGSGSSGFARKQTPLHPLSANKTIDHYPALRWEGGECVPSTPNRRPDYSRPPPCVSSSSSPSSCRRRRSCAKKKPQNAIPQMEIFRFMMFLATRLPEPVVSPSAVVAASLVCRTRCAC